MPTTQELQHLVLRTVLSHAAAAGSVTEVKRILALVPKVEESVVTLQAFLAAQPVVQMPSAGTAAGVADAVTRVLLGALLPNAAGAAGALLTAVEALGKDIESALRPPSLVIDEQDGPIVHDDLK